MVLVRVPDSGDPGSPTRRRRAARAGARVGEDGARLPALAHGDPHHPLAGVVHVVILLDVTGIVIALLFFTLIFLK